MIERFWFLSLPMARRGERGARRHQSSSRGVVVNEMWTIDMTTVAVLSIVTIRDVMRTLKTKVLNSTVFHLNSSTIATKREDNGSCVAAHGN